MVVGGEGLQLWLVMVIWPMLMVIWPMLVVIGTMLLVIGSMGLVIGPMLVVMERWNAALIPSVNVSLMFPWMGWTEWIGWRVGPPTHGH
mgnify:CR=1 FL=1